MRDQSGEKNNEGSVSRQQRQRSTSRRAGPQGLAAAQASAGNAAVVQMLRNAGHPWAQDQHQHGPDCGHRSDGPATVQRRVAVSNEFAGPEAEMQQAKAEEAGMQRESLDKVLKSPGRPLEPQVASELGALMGSNFSTVRMHDDAAAAESAKMMGAHALTAGEHIVVGDRPLDRHTMIHELEHVKQQRSGDVEGTVQRSGIKVSHPDDKHEKAAEATAHALSSAPVPAPSEHAEAPAHGAHASHDGDALAAPAVQRRVSLKDPETSTTQALESFDDVKAFLRQFKVSVELIYSARHHLSPLRAAGVMGFRLVPAVDQVLNDSEARVYEKSADGAKKLAEAICEKIGDPPKEAAGNRAEAGPAGPSKNMSVYDMAPELLQRLSAARPGAGRPAAQPAVGLGTAGLADALSQRVRPELAQRTPENPISAGFMEGVSGAVTGRLDALSGGPQAPEKTVEMVRWGLWTANNLEKANSVVEEIANRASESEGKGLRNDWEALKSENAKKALSSATGSAAMGMGIGKAMSAVPHPIVSAAGRALSMVAGGVAAHNKIADQYETIERFQKEHPAVFEAVKRQRDADLRGMSARNHETIQDVWANSEWG
ncbi:MULTISPECIES: eCIS core domain-containing protein [Streptomyces]